jgi:hypothetical protein
MSARAIVAHLLPDPGRQLGKTREDPQSGKETYWSSSKQNLGRLAASDAVEKLVDDLLGHLELHNLQAIVLCFRCADAGIRSPPEQEASGCHGQRTNGEGECRKPW